MHILLNDFFWNMDEVIKVLKDVQMQTKILKKSSLWKNEETLVLYLFHL